MSRPVLAHTRAELAEVLDARRRAGERVGFVPTMGALHNGHASLMKVARGEIGDGPLVVSIFVNPLQFGAGEDLDRYPRSLDVDLKVCERESVDVVFVPSVDEVYPGGVPTSTTTDAVTVEPGSLADVLEGRSRPGHFRGVLTVVAKLLGLVRPDVAVFGQKDYQQLVLIRRMVADLCLGADVVGAETEREPDGLALSSRNRYLDPEQRHQAVALNRTLRAAQLAAVHGVDAALDAARAELREAMGVDLEYLAITTPDLHDLTEGDTDLAPGSEGRVLIAARIGTTRLIDNLPLTLGGDH
ncbi:MAG: pantoate--beta-alanine ligase [Nocardioides sp.]